MRRYYRKQKEYNDCQLIAAINARIWLGGTDVPEDEYEELVDLSKARFEAALNVEEAYPFLGMDYIDHFSLDLEWIKNNLPVELAICSPTLGFHSILVVGATKNCLRVINHTGRRFLKWSEVLEQKPPEHVMRVRSFKLRGT